LSERGEEIQRKRTNPFYAYSHKKVLLRRGSTKLRAISKQWGRLNGGDELHLIGSPFIQGPALRIVVRTPHGEVSVQPSEFYSDTVLFFELPSYPVVDLSQLPPNVEIPAQILVSNEGRTYSNPIDFLYVGEGNSRSRF